MQHLDLVFHKYETVLVLVLVLILVLVLVLVRQEKPPRVLAFLGP